MAINKRGKWWKGTGPADIEEYLHELKPAGYVPDRVDHARCACQGQVFAVRRDQDEGVAVRICIACSNEHLMLDGAEYIEDADLREVRCTCHAGSYNVAVGFAHREDGSIRWVSVGLRCTSCGVLACCADWKIDYAPTEHLYPLV